MAIIFFQSKINPFLQKNQNKFSNHAKNLYICKPQERNSKNYQQYKQRNFKKMTKADIINKISAATGLPKKDVAVTVEAFMDTIKNSLLEKENVYLRGFGSFIVKHRAKKTARNISKNTTIVISAHDFPSFKPAKSFVSKMKGEEVTDEDID